MYGLNYHFIFNLVLGRGGRECESAVVGFRKGSSYLEYYRVLAFSFCLPLGAKRNQIVHWIDFIG
jgi:hypothetical protein